MNSKNSSIKHNFFMNIVLTISSLIFPLITFPYISRVLLPDGTGRIAFANSVISYFSMFASLGIPTYGIRACARVRENKLALSKTVHEICFLNAIMTVCVYMIFGIAILKIPVLKQEALLLTILSLNILLNLIGIEWLFKGLECYTYITVRSILFKGIGILLMLIFVHEKSDYNIYGVITVFASTGYGIYNLVYAHKFIYINKIQNYNIRCHIKPIITFFTMTAAATVYTNLDIAMLGFVRGRTEVGYYDVAIKIKMILVGIVTALGAVILPRASYYIENERRKDFYDLIEKAAELIVTISIPLAVFFMIMAKESILLLAGKEYLTAVLPMIIIMPTLILIGFSNLFGMQILVPLGKEKVVMYSEVIGAVVDIILNIALIPKYGASGAAFGTLIAEVSVLFFQYLSLKKHIPPIWKNLKIKKIFISVLISTLLLQTVKFYNINLILKLTLAVVVFFIPYAGLLIILKEPSMEMLINTIKKHINNS